MTLTTGSWSGKDNKHYRGHLDRINVSITEEWEVEYFIDKFLTSHNYSLSAPNREVVLKAISEYQGRKPVLREKLNAYLEQKLLKK
ncbi:hypothetical protein D3C87_1927900 [compost metagenome]|uniref:hypothetical protein n=1 Tax=Cupriavidus sp. SIMBA_020 TaxID=3085766 RepID=UPI000F95BBAE